MNWDKEVLRSQLESVMGHTPSHFLDSGAYSQILQSKRFAKETGRGRLAYFRTKSFRRYLDSYAKFIKKYRRAIDVYANVDIILEGGLDLEKASLNNSAKLSYQNLKYLEEEHGLSPIPVLHVGESLKWLDIYLDEGYDFLALGGVLRKSDRRKGKVVPKAWVDDFFRKICPPPSCIPIAKVHGFGIGASVPSMVRYPWWSADSTAWVKMPCYGQIVMPDTRGKTWSFLTGNKRIFTPADSPYIVTSFKGQRHYQGLPKVRKREVRKWLDFIGVPFGKEKVKRVRNKKTGRTELKIVEVIEHGVTNNIFCRYSAIIRYTELFVKALPEWPWPFKVKPNLNPLGLSE